MADPTSTDPGGPAAGNASSGPPLMAAPTPELLPGAVFAGYRIQAKLGQGGMGVVFRAVDTTLERAVALKLMRPELAADQDFAARFLREARTAAQVMHPHVIVIHQAGTHAGSLYMAFEFVAGGDLAGRIRRDGPMPLGAALRMIAQCADGLQAIHEAGMVHRDIKPQNIFLDDHGRAKLGDLGLARHADGDDRMTMTGVGMGTPAFMSPEQAEGAADLDIRSDIHALGATLFMMLTGKAPFSGTTPYAITHQIIAGERPCVRDLRPEVPVAVQDVVLQAMARERSRRYATPAELLAAVEHLLMAIGVGASGGGWSGQAISGARGLDTTRPTQNGEMGLGATTSVTAGSNLAVSPTMTVAPNPGAKASASDPASMLAATAILPTRVASGRADHPTMANTAAMPTLGHQPATVAAGRVDTSVARGPRAKRRSEGGPSSLGAVVIAIAIVAVVIIAAVAYFAGKRSDEPVAARAPDGVQVGPLLPSGTAPVAPTPGPVVPPVASPPLVVPPVASPPLAVAPAPNPGPGPMLPPPVAQPVLMPTPAVTAEPVSHPPPRPALEDAPQATAPPPHPTSPPVTMAPTPASSSIAPPPVAVPTPAPPPVAVTSPPVAVTPPPVAVTPPPAPDRPQTPTEHLDSLLDSEHFQEALRFASRMGDDDAIAEARQRVMHRHDQRKNQVQTRVDAAQTMARARALLQPAMETWGMPGDRLWAEALLLAKARDLGNSQ